MKLQIGSVKCKYPQAVLIKQHGRKAALDKNRSFLMSVRRSERESAWKREKEKEVTEREREKRKCLEGLITRNKKQKITEEENLLIPAHWSSGLSVHQWSRRPGFSPGRIIPKTLKMVLDTSLINIQQYKVHIKGKMEQSWDRSSTLPYTSV